MMARRAVLMMALWWLSVVRCRSQREEAEWVQPQCGPVQELQEGYGKSMGLILDEDSLEESKQLLPLLYLTPSSIYAAVFNASGIMKAKKVDSGWPGVETWMRQEGMYETSPVKLRQVPGPYDPPEKHHRGGATMYALLTLAQELPRGAPVALITSREPSDIDLARQANYQLIRKNIPVTIIWTGTARSGRSSLDDVATNTGGVLQESLNEVNTLNQITLVERENLKGTSNNRIEVDPTLDDLIVTIRGNISSALLLPPEGNGYHMRDECRNGEYKMKVGIKGQTKGSWYLDITGRDSEVYNVTVAATSHLAEWATASNINTTGERFNRLTQNLEGAWQPFSIEVDLGSMLTAVAGQRAAIYFKVRNNRFEPVYYDYTVNDKYGWVRFGNARRSLINGQSEDRVKVDIQTPYSSETQTQEPDIVTFTAYPPTGGTVRQRAYFRIGQMDYDSTSPSISYSYNGDCSNNLSPNKCSYGTWGANITLQDSGSGLLQISSTPVQIQLNREFIAGTTNPVYAMFIATCCQTKIEVTAKDAIGNKYSRIIDVEQASWTTATISAVVLGSLLLLIIIIVIVGVICWRCRSRRTLAIYPNN